MNGQMSLLAIFPERECVVGIITNSSNGGSLTYAMLEWCITSVLGMALPTLPRFIQELPASAGSGGRLSIMSQYEGEYFNEGSLSKVVVTAADGPDDGRGKLRVSYRKHTHALGYADESATSAEEQQAAAEDDGEEEAELAGWVGEDLFLVEPAKADEEDSGKLALGETLGAEYLRFHRDDSTPSREVAWVCTGRLMRRHPLIPPACAPAARL